MPPFHQEREGGGRLPHTEQEKLWGSPADTGAGGASPGGEGDMEANSGGTGDDNDKFIKRRNIHIIFTDLQYVYDTIFTESTGS